jgi:hypothetical protein
MERSNNCFAREGGGAACETSIAALRVRDLGSRQMTPLLGSTGNAFLFSQFGLLIESYRDSVPRYLNFS